MTSTKSLSPQARSDRNGRICEQLIKKQYKGLILTHKEVDGEYQGKPIEIKGCLEKIPRTDGEAKDRSGQLHFKGWQHDFLLQNNGNYAIGVYFGKRLIKHAVIPAEKVFPDHFDGEKTFSWVTILKGVV